MPRSELSVVALKSGLLLSILVAASFWSGVAAMAPPFSATCVLLVLLPSAPFSAPRTVLVSHLLCLSTGVLFLLLPKLLAPILLVLCAAWVALILMAWLRAVHAPALAHTVILSMGQQQITSYVGWSTSIVISFTLLALYEVRRTTTKQHLLRSTVIS